MRTEKILKYEWKDSISEWHTCLQRLQECFSILFPRMSSSNTDKNKSMVNSLCSSKSLSDSSIADAAIATSIVYDESNNSISDYSDVNWLDEDNDIDNNNGDNKGNNVEENNYSSSDEDNDGDNSLAYTGGVPYTLVP